MPAGGEDQEAPDHYDSEDTTVVLSRDQCGCGRTHMRIYNPQREAETIWVYSNSINRVYVEAAVFQHESMEYLTGEYEAFLYDGDKSGEAVLRIRLEYFDADRVKKKNGWKSVY